MSLPQRTDFRFLHRLRVRWAEVDMQKIVFNAHYLMYLDTAMGDYWRALALPYEAAMAELGGELYVKKATLEYHGSARYDDALDIGLKCQRIGTTSVLFHAGIFLGEALRVSGELVYVFADPTTQTSRPVPELLRTVLLDYESNQPVTTLRCGSWADLAQGARAVRTEVFLQEQGIPVEMEWDADDASAVHAVVRNALDMPVATGRLLQTAPGIARIGRMAVSRVLRGTGLGQAVLLALLQASHERGDREVMLHAQRSAEGFYRRLGFVARGEPFEEAGLPHIEMVRVG